MFFECGWCHRQGDDAEIKAHKCPVKPEAFPEGNMKIDWNPGDSRSYGHIKIEASTRLGTLILHHKLDQAGQFDQIDLFTIAGHKVDGFNDNMSEACPDIGAPHDSQSRTVKTRFSENKEKWVKAAVDRWVEDEFIPTLKELAHEGNTNPWGVR